MINYNNDIVFKKNFKKKTHTHSLLEKKELFHLWSKNIHNNKNNTNPNISPNK